MAKQRDPLLMLAAGVLLSLGGKELWDYAKKQIRAHTHAQASDMRLKIQGVHMENDGTINMDMLVLNPNSAAFRIQSVLGDLMVNNRKIAELRMFGDYTVRPNDQATIPLMAKIPTMQIFNSLVQLFRGHGALVSFHGTINVNDKAVPLTFQYKAA